MQNIIVIKISHFAEHFYKTIFVKIGDSKLPHSVDDATGHIHHIGSYCHTRLVTHNHSRFQFDVQRSIAAVGCRSNNVWKWLELVSAETIYKMSSQF